MKIRKNIWIMFVLAIIIAFVMWTPGTTGNVVLRTEVLEVAVIIPLTGPVAPIGEDFLNGMLLAKKDLGSDVVLHVEDSQSNAKDGIAAAHKLLNTEDVDAIVSLQSSVVVPLISIAEQYDKPLIATAISHDDFAQRSDKTFRLFPPARQDAALAAEFASKTFTDISVLTVLDEYGESVKEHFKMNYKGNIVQQESFDVSERDFRTFLTGFSGDALFYVGYIPHSINLLKQREELGMDFAIISNVNMASNRVRSEAGDLMSDVYVTVPESIVGGGTAEFVDSYTEKYGKRPDWGAPFGYDMMLLLEAVQENGGDALDALHSIEIDGLNGMISFDEHGEASIPMVLVEIS